MDGRHNNHGKVGQHHRVDWKADDTVYLYGLGCPYSKKCFEDCPFDDDCHWNGVKKKRDQVILESMKL